jgi:glucosamine--fructose-6-phosphate aminotransferase (isomerizing)
LAIDKVRTFPNVKTLSITCDIESKNYNDYVILSPEADEQSIIMTKSFTSMLYIAIIMAMYVGGKKEEIASMMKYDRIKGDIILPMDKKAKSIVYDNPNLNLFIILGQGVFYGVANECMNKIKEMAIENSEAYQSMEYRHGPMSLVDKNTLIITLANEKTREYDVKLMKQMREYGAVTAAIGHNVSQTMPYVNYSFDMPDSFNDMQNAAFIGIFGQLIGYYLAEKKNIDADFPRHLSQAIVLDDGQVSYHPGK